VDLAPDGASVAAPWAGGAGTAEGPGYHPARLKPGAPSLSHGSLALFAVGLLLFAAATVRPLAWLTAGGAAGAWVLGTATVWRFGTAGFAALFAPFVLATVLGKLPGGPRAPARTLRQVAANGMPALVGCALDLAGLPAAGLALFLGGLACLGSDTCATEVGTRYGGEPRSLFGGRPLRRGESGGVTGAGLLASAGGAFLAPAAFAAVVPTPLSVVGLAAAAGFAGALLDSLLGGTLQYRGKDPGTGATVEATHVRGARTERVSGLRALDNDAVNLVAGLAAGLLAVALLA
jgi:uncharacterized membrane protein